MSWLGPDCWAFPKLNDFDYASRAERVAVLEREARDRQGGWTGMKWASKAVNGLLGQFDLRLSRGAGFCVELRGSADSGQPLRDTRAGNHVE